MLAVHFGAGNIGRGFIGQILHNAGYEVCFVDVNSEIINEINQKKSYFVQIADDTHSKTEITNIKGINSIENKDEVIEAISKADIVTTAVGATILPKISELIAKGIEKRQGKLLNIIACENMLNGSSFLKEELSKYTTDFKNIGFPNSAVDRIVPAQNNVDKLLVIVEPFYEWVVETSEMVGEKPNINGITYVENLQPFIERKLFTLNTGHAFTAYLGSYKNIKTIEEALKDEEVKQELLNVLKETSQMLIKKHGFNEQTHNDYINKIVKRFENKYIVDEVSRVGRSPIRKISKNDRLVKPALELIKMKYSPQYLAKGIALALKYTNEEDLEAIELNNYLKENGVEKTLIKYSELQNCQELINLVIEQYEKL